jgi:hypothetical protein
MNSELNESQLYEKCYLMLLANVNVHNFDIGDTVTYPQMDTCEECGEHQVSESGETFQMDWDDDVTIKIERLASGAVQDILRYRKAVQDRAVQETKN